MRHTQNNDMKVGDGLLRREKAFSRTGGIKQANGFLQGRTCMELPKNKKIYFEEL